MARRGAKGSIVKRGKCYYIVYYTPKGKQKWESGFTNRTAAADYLREVLGDIAHGTYREPKPILFKDFADQWLNDRKGNIKPATYSEYGQSTGLVEGAGGGETPLPG